MFTKNERKIFIVAAGITFGLSMAMAVSQAAWQGPTETPPAGNVILSDVIDGSSNQQKSGLLTLTNGATGLIVNPGKLGVGTTNPGGAIGIGTTTAYIDVDGSGNLTFTDAFAGTKTLTELYDSGSGDFSEGGDDAGADRSLGNNDAYAMSLETSGLGRIYIAANGLVGIGNASPQARLDVSGGVKIGTTVSACDGTTAGTVRYDSGGGTMEYCNGIDWTAF